MSDAARTRLLEAAISQLSAGVVVIDPTFEVVYWNRFMEIHSGRPAAQVEGRNLFALFPELPRGWLEKKIKAVFLIRNTAFTSWRQRPFLFRFETTYAITGTDEPMYQNCVFSPIDDGEGRVTHVGITLFDATEIALAHRQLAANAEALREKQEEQRQLISRLEEAQNQLLQSEKMASIGQLAAGVAHEINNPIGYVLSNITTLDSYVGDLLKVIAFYERCEPRLARDEQVAARLAKLKASVDLDYLKEDLVSLVEESQEGIQRVRKIVQDLKDFSHVDRAESQPADLHHGLDSTLNVVHNEVKYRADMVKEYGDIPPVLCRLSQINQVFMNLLVNAAQAFDGNTRGTITIRTGTADDGVWVEIADTGKGIPPAHLNRIFDPFFTTKPVGKGTGLGLSLSYGIVKKHGGELTVASEVGKGSRFRLWLPLAEKAEDVDTPETEQPTAGRRDP